MFARSEVLTESRALPEYPEKLMNAIVPRMTRMVITTMSSTRVKPPHPGPLLLKERE
jgi:hypothetical protein